MSKRIVLILLLVATPFIGLSQESKESFHDVIHIKGSVYTLRPNHPKFGNPSTVVSIGRKDVFMADVGPLEFVPNLLNEIKKIGGKNIKYITTSHHHGDHTEGLKYFSTTNAIHIVPTKQREYLGSSRIFLNGDTHEESSLPKLTFDSSVTIHLEEEEIKIFTGTNKNGHTGGDAFVYFKTSKVLYLGDYVFLNHFPIIDLNNDGSVIGFLENLNSILHRFPDETIIIPGHGTLRPAPIKTTTIKELKHYYEQLKVSVNWIKDQISDGKTLIEIQEKGLPKEFNSFDEGAIYIKSKQWITIVDEFYRNK